MMTKDEEHPCMTDDGICEYLMDYGKDKDYCDISQCVIKPWAHTNPPKTCVFRMENIGYPGIFKVLMDRILGHKDKEYAGVLYWTLIRKGKVK